MEDISVLDLLKSNYKQFGEYVNATRGNVGLDGLKSVQRRVLLSVKDCDKQGEDIGSSEVVAHCLNNYHPHGDSSIYDTLCRLVQKGFVLGQSNFGNIDTFESSDPASYRYTSIKNHKQFSDGVFKFVNRVDSVENEYGRMEPKYLPVPIPLALTTGASGIGFGLHSSIPMFSARSIFEALQKDSPSPLKAPNGIYIVNSELEDIWTKGSGFIQYGYKCYTQHRELEGKEISVIEGPGRYFPTSVNHVFEKLEEEGSVIIRDESSKVTRVVISRVKNIKKINDEEVHKLAQQASVNNMFFRIYINEEGISRRISVQQWLQKLWKTYEKIVEDYKLEKIKEIKNKIKIVNLIPKVSPLIRKELSSEDIASKLGVDISIVKEIENKPIRILKNTEFTKELNDYNQQVVDTSKISAKILAKDVVELLEKAQTV